MTNRKLKPGRVHYNIQCRTAYETGTRNLMTMYLCLYRMGVSKNKILGTDDDLITDTVKQYKQDAADGVGDIKIKRFLKSVDISFDRIIQTAAKLSLPYLIPAKFDKDQLAGITESLANDIAMYLCEVNTMLGFGHTRLDRLLTAMNEYKGDALKEAADIFGFVYGDAQEIPDITRAREKKTKLHIDKSIADKLIQQWT